jgi:Methyltransferase domain
MTTHPELAWPARLKAIRKLAIRAKPYLLIPIQPDTMLPRGVDRVFAPVLALLRQAEPEVEALLGALAPGLDRAQHALGSLADNEYFFGGDACVAYAMIQHLRPQRLIEIGSGHSTHIMRRAARDAGHALSITCVDPEPRRDIEDVADMVVRRSVLELGESVADGLADGDVLFIDGSHYAFNGSDVPFLLLEVLPRLKSGVVIHVHDIMLPYEYTSVYTARNYNEQYVLAALLLGGPAFQPLLPVYWLVRKGRLPAGGSFWMRRS